MIWILYKRERENWKKIYQNITCKTYGFFFFFFLKNCLSKILQWAVNTFMLNSSTEKSYSNEQTAYRPIFLDSVFADSKQTFPTGS